MKNLRLHVWNFISTKLTDRSSILWNTLHIFGSQALLTFKINSLKFFAIKWLYMKNLKLYYLKILKVKYFILRTSLCLSLPPFLPSFRWITLENPHAFSKRKGIWVKTDSKWDFLPLFIYLLASHLPLYVNYNNNSLWKI